MILSWKHLVLFGTSVKAGKFATSVWGNVDDRKTQTDTPDEYMEKAF